VVIRVEQLYPFPEQAIRECLEKFPTIGQVTWVQEESRNTGAWSYVNERFLRYFPTFKISYVGRDENFSTATGYYNQYKKSQKKIVEDAFGVSA
jgi:2-oxoglutarate dehydrogenase E1 component